MKNLIVGLGNIGQEYADTRHNIGFMVLDRFAHKHASSFKTARYADVGLIKFKGRSLVMVKPNTYMNLSGKSVRYYLEKEKINKDHLLVITDDIALPLGKLRMRAKGSNAGHNGLGSIDELTGGNDYARLKFGIGNDFPKGHQVDYVLSAFNDEEKVILPSLLDRAVEMIESFATVGIARTMNQYNN
jgi:PTH1 family peptidyl-tRNA hydrolase